MIGKWLALVVCFLSIEQSTSEITSGNVKLTYEQFFKGGVEAYLENRWIDCVALLEKAIEEYFYYNTIIIQCRRNCQKENTELFYNASENLPDLWHLQTKVTEIALCLMTCQNFYFQNRPKTSREIDENFANKVPYNYLQLCYFKIGESEKAASCAYTFLIHNPHHEVMQTNLQYYMALPDINVDKVKYLEPKTYQDLFLKGAQLYTDGKYAASIEVMELSLKEYVLAEEDCRLHCEKPIIELSREELYVSISNQFTYTLRCKLHCAEILSYMYGQQHDDLFATHYHYLQFSYHKIQRHKDACLAVASFLLLHPNDSTMLSNQLYYSKQPDVSKEWFTPRKEAVEYFEQSTREKNLLEAIEKAFHFTDNSTQESQVLTPPPKSTSTQKFSLDKKSLGKAKKKLTESQIFKWLKKSGISLDIKEKELNGTNRVAFSNLATLAECQQLVDLAMEGGVYGDGYNGKQSPHTEFEMFEGLTIARAATLAQRGILNPAAAELFLHISEKARHAVEVYFNLDTELFFAYTHLVCRTSLPDSPDYREDLSHPIHADNCVLTSNGKCLKEKPAYTWRDYSSIVYLNEEFEGGEFIFAEDKKTVQAALKPKCGLMVAFSAGAENLHGVKAVRKGKRCALAMWYTLDANHREKERDFAKIVLTNLTQKKEFSTRDTSAQSFEKATLTKFAQPISRPQHKHTEL